MQARLQEIRDRMSNNNDEPITVIDYVIDVPYLLDALEQAQNENDKLKESNIFYKDSYKKRLEIESDIAEMLGLEVDCGVLENIASKVELMQARERVLREALVDLINTINDQFGIIIGNQVVYIPEFDLEIDPKLEPWDSVFDARGKAEQALKREDNP